MSVHRRGTWVGPLLASALAVGLAPPLQAQAAPGPDRVRNGTGSSRIAAARRPSRARVEAALEDLHWRSIGPADMGGRTTDVAAIPGDPSTVYFATASGGLWKTSNAGTTWSPLFEEGGTLSIGDIALAPSDPNVLYVGTGENNARNSTSIGDGVYRSTDGGSTWSHLGLTDTERIGRIVVDPSDPDLVYVAAMGHLWGPNEQRGLFRSRDGGATWEKLLYVDANTGAVDVILSPGNTRILFAAMYEFRRSPYHFRSGGTGSGLYRSTDGGASWKRLTDPAFHNGLPTGVLGRIGLAIATSDPDVVYATIEAKSGVLWRSSDGGETWERMSGDRRINSRPFYFSGIRVDPTDPDRIYAVAGGLRVSEDGGRSWKRIARNIHGDHHALWIDPENPRRLIDGNDGGFEFSYDGGETWEFSNTVPLAQFYHIAVDLREPYRVCGGLQDNDAWCGPSRTLNVAGALQNSWYEIIGPGDGMYVQIDPRDPDVMYADAQGGDVYRVNLKTGEARSIQPYPVPLSGAAERHEFRFNWNAPLLMSPHDPETIYLGGNVLFRTRDGGQTWERISPDLSNAKPEQLKSSGGPITPDNTTAEYHATIYALAESPVEPGVIWAGTDDGNLQLTRDGGATWTELSGRVPHLPRGSWVSSIEASRTSGGTAYVSFDRHRSDDMAPYVFKTTDYGTRWTSVADDLPARGYVHVVREDPRNPDLVYAGTELGLWASWTGGGHWASLRLGLPPVAVRDLVVHPRDDDLVIGTHGRSVWILDDARALQELPSALESRAYLFAPHPATRYEPAARRFRFDIGSHVFVGENPPYGALLTYYLSEDVPAAPADSGRSSARPADERAKEPEIELVILDATGDTVRTLEAPGTAGVHRIAWDLRERPLPKDESGGEDAETGPFDRGPTAPRVLPGAYTVRLSALGEALQVGLEVRLDPRLRVSESDLAAQHASLGRLFDAVRQATEARRSIDRVKAQLETWIDRLARTEGEPAGPAVDTARAIVERLGSLRREIERDSDDAAAGTGTAAPLLARITSLMRRIGRSSERPTAAQEDWADRYVRELADLRARLNDALDQRVGRLNRTLRETGLPPVALPGSRR